MRKVEPIKIEKEMKVSELVEGMRNMGFGAGRIARASDIMREMFGDKECKVFLGVAGAMVPAGMKQIIMDLLDDTDVFVTTGANLPKGERCCFRRIGRPTAGMGNWRGGVRHCCRRDCAVLPGRFSRSAPDGMVVLVGASLPDGV